MWNGIQISSLGKTSDRINTYKYVLILDTVTTSHYVVNEKFLKDIHESDQVMNFSTNVGSKVINHKGEHLDLV